MSDQFRSPSARRFPPATRAARSRRPHPVRLTALPLEDRTVPAGSVLTSGLFQLDGNALTSLQSTPPALHDFDQVYSPATYGSPGGQSPTFLSDGLAANNGGSGALLDTTVFTGGSTKDTSDVSQWLWTTTNLQAKNDLENAYAVGYVNPADGHLLLYFGTDRVDNNGDAFVGFWFFRSAISLNPNGTFNGVHTNGDILLQANVSSTSAEIQLNQWLNGALVPLTDVGGAAFGPDVAFLTSNAAPTPAPWPYRFGNGNPPPLVSDFPAQTYFEGGIDLTAALNTTDCIRFVSFLAETRSSSSFSATLSDFALGSVNINNCPDVAVTNTPVRPVVAAGETAGFDVTVANVGAAPATGVALSYPLPDLGGGNAWSIDPAAGDGAFFEIVGPAGAQTLRLAPGVTDLAAGATLTVRVLGTTTAPGTLAGTATVSAANEEADVLGNNQAAAAVLVNGPPVARNNAAAVAEDLVLTDSGNVITDTDGFGADSDPENDPLTVTRVAFGAAVVPVTGPGTQLAGAYGTLAIGPDGAYTYTLDTALPAVQALGVGESLTETFTYTVSDPFGNTAAADLVVTITGTNDPPVARPNTAAVAEDVALADSGNVIADDDGFGFDSDIDGDALRVTGIAFGGTAVPVPGPGPGVIGGAYGTLVVGPDGSYTYTLNNALPAVQALRAGETLTEVFTYAITDGTAGASSTLTVTVLGTNDPPDARDNAYATPAGTPVGGNAVTDDTGAGVDADPDAGETPLLRVVAVNGLQGNVGTAFALPSGGTLRVNADGTFTYTPPPGYVGPDSFTYTVADPAGATDTATVFLTVTPSADLVVEKAGPPAAVPGGTVAYTITVRNDGATPAQNVIVTDQLPAGTTFVSLTGPAGSAFTPTTPPAGQGGTVTLTAASLAAGASETFTLVLRIASGLTAPLTNQAAGTTTTPETDTGNNSGTAVTPLTPRADLGVTKDDSSPTYTAGTTLTYTITVTNDGPSDAVNVAFADPLPAGTTLLGVSVPAGWTRTDATAPGTNGTIRAAIGALPAGSGPQVFTITVLVGSGVTGPLSNTASVSADTADPVEGNNDATDTDAPAPVADLRVAKDDGSPTYTPGRTVRYTVVVTNAGPSDVTGAVVRDALPGQLTSVTWAVTYSPGASGPAGGTGDVTAAVNLPSGGTATFTIDAVVRTDATGPLVNTATVSAPAGVTDPDGNNNADTDTDAVAPVADLRVTKTDGLATAVPGTPVTYTVVVTNAGPSAVTGARVRDLFPAALTGVTWSAAFTPGSSGTAGGAGSIDELVNLAAGGSVTYTVTGTIDPAATGSLSNTATVDPPAGVTDPDGTNNADTDTDVLTPTADLSVTKTDDAPTYTPGTATTYRIVVRNAGPSAVTGATLRDVLPSQVSAATWQAAYTGGGSGPAAGSGSITAPLHLPPGATATFTVVADVRPDATGDLVNTAEIDVPAGVTDPAPGNNAATDTDAPAPRADLRVTKTDGADFAVPGGTVTYTVVVTNAGPSAVTAARLRDALPAGVTAASWAATYAGGATGPAAGSGGIDTLLDLPAGATATFRVTMTLSPAATGSLANTVTITPPDGVTDPTPGNNAATDTDTITPVADVRVTKTDGSPTAVPGTRVTYTVVVTNTGPSTATGVSVADAFPAALTGVSWASTAAGGATGNTAAGTGDIADTVTLPPGAAVTYTVTGTVSPAATGTLSNTATARVPDGITDPDPTNNAATDTDTLTPVADLRVTKTDGAATAVPGTRVTYTVVVTNAGPSAVSGAAVRDAVPAGLTTVAWTAVGTGGAGGFTSGTGNLLADTVFLPAGATITYTITGLVRPTATGTLANTATVAAPPGVTDPDPDNNAATDTNTLTPVADLRMTKTDGSATYTPGRTITYTLTVTNAGPSAAAGAVVSDVLPAQLTGATWTVAYTGGGAGPAAGAGDVTAVIDLPAGATATFTVTATARPDATGVLVNRSTVAVPPGVTDPNPADNAAADADDPAPVADLRVTKTNGTTAARPGQTLTYTITVTNAGPSDAPGVVLTDTLPALTAFAAASDGGTFANGVVTWAVGTVPAGATITRTVTVVVAAAVPAGATTLANTAAARSDVPDANPDDNRATDTDALGGAPDLVVVKTDGVTQARPGDTLTYTITVTNAGDRGATGVVLTDTLPAHTAFASADGGGTFAGGVVTWAVGDLPAGASATRTVTVAVAGTTPAGVTALVNTAAARDDGANGPDRNATDNTATDTDVLGAAGVISGVAFVDRDNDGVRDPGEPGIPLVALTLTGTDDLGNPVALTTTTAGDGTYAFPGLRPGTYRIAEAQPEGLLDGRDTAGGLGGAAGNDAFEVTLANGQSAGGFGFGELVPSSVTGLVFADRNGNGAADPADLGVPGVEVVLTGTDDLGNLVSVTAVTAADGTYAFTGLRPGTYRVARTTLPAGLAAGGNEVGTSGGALAGQSAITDITLAQNAAAARYQFGLRPDDPSKRDFLGSTPTRATAGGTAPAQGMSLPRTIPAMALASRLILTAPGTGAPPVVRATDPATGAEVFSFAPFGSGFRGGVRLAVADLTGDGVPDLVTAAGPGGGPHVRAFDGRTGGQLAGPLGSFYAFEPGFTGGLTVAAGDVTGDGLAEVIVGAGAGGGPRVAVFGAGGARLADFFAFEERFRGGASVAAGDVDGDGTADVIAGAGAGGGPRVVAFRGTDRAVLADFLAFDPVFTGGVDVAAADLNGDGHADVLAGAGRGGAPRMKAVSGRDGTVLADFFAFGPGARGGVSVAAADVDGDGRPDLLAGAGPGDDPLVRAFDAATLAELAAFTAYDPAFVRSGVYVRGT